MGKLEECEKNSSACSRVILKNVWKEEPKKAGWKPKATYLDYLSVMGYLNKETMEGYTLEDVGVGKVVDQRRFSFRDNYFNSVG